MKEIFDSSLFWIASSIGGLFAWLGDFTADLFWNVATSLPVLIAIALIGGVAFLVAHIPPIAERLFPVLVPYTRLALLAQVAAFAALAFLIGFRVADDRAETERLKNDLAYSEFMLDQQRQVTEVAEKLKREADAETAAARVRLNAYEQKFGPDPSTGFGKPPGFDEWLRTFQRRPRHAGAGADQPRRNLIARVRALGGQR